MTITQVERLPFIRQRTTKDGTVIYELHKPGTSFTLLLSHTELKALQASIAQAVPGA